MNRDRERAAPPCVVLGGFLEPLAVPALLEFVAAQQSAFQSSSAGEGWEDTRRSEVLFDIGPWREVLRDRVQMHRHWVADALGIPAFEAGEIETQITHSGDGAFFDGHNDVGVPSVASRVLTFVCYFHREPKAFTGGDLLLYEETDWHRWRQEPGAYHRIEPVSNTVVFFPAAAIHEVERVSVPSGEFMDGRFTLNGWVRRAV
jgi:SM-20-related protein